MSDLTTLLSSVVAIAKNDIASDVLPAVTNVLPQLVVSPSTAVPVLLTALATSGAKLAADEVVAVEGWAVTEMKKLVAAIPTKV